MSSNTVEYVKKDLPSSVNKIGIALLAAGLLVVVFSYLVDPTRSAFNNLILLMFLTSIGLGSLFLVAIEYLGGAVWSTPFRRVSEFLAAILIIAPIVAIPLYFNLHDIFHWTHAEAVAEDAVLKGKSSYLNESFFIIRFLAFFTIWLMFYFVITKNSKKQDETKDQKLTSKNIKLSAVFMPLFALTITFFAIDWIMSLNPHWFSTIFGVYYFTGTLLAALAAGTFIIVKLNENGYLIKGLTKDHYYSLGALLFAFTNFWAYIAFSQFMLIWYANLPEETVFFMDRFQGSWVYISVGLIFIRFVIPYAGLLSQPSKMNGKNLKFFSLWILFAHFYDLYWLIMPNYSKDGFVFGWIELGYPLVAIGIIILVFSMKARKENAVPIGDPKLQRGLDFRL